MDDADLSTVELADLLQTVGLKVEVTEVAGWDAGQRQAAARWAVAAHFSALGATDAVPLPGFLAGRMTP